MDKPFDATLNRLSQNQLIVLRTLLLKPETVITTRELAKKTGVMEKQLGGVLSALSRRRVAGVSLLTPMGRDGAYGLRWKLNTKALTVLLAIKQVKLLLASY